MKMRELVEKLLEIEAARQAVVEAHNSLNYGGNAATMERKGDWLDACEKHLEDLLDQEIILDEGEL